MQIIDPDSYMYWHVTTQPLQSGRGHVINVPFEQQVSDVTEYIADYWLLFKRHRHQTRKYLAYTQTILMKMQIKDMKFVFPHVTCNTVTYS